MGATWTDDPVPAPGAFQHALPAAIIYRAKKMGHEEIIGLVGVLARTVGMNYGNAGAETLAIHYNRDSRRIRRDHPFRAGFPDLVIAGPGGVLFAEIKGKDDTVSAEQRTWLARLAGAGAIAVVWEALDVMNGRAETELAALCVRSPYLARATTA